VRSSVLVGAPPATDGMMLAKFVGPSVPSLSKSVYLAVRKSVPVSTQDASSVVILSVEDDPFEVEAAVPDSLVEQAVEAIVAAAATGSIGDGKVFVSDLAQATRIRTGETGEQAL